VSRRPRVAQGRRATLGLRSRIPRARYLLIKSGRAISGDKARDCPETFASAIRADNRISAFSLRVEANESTARQVSIEGKCMSPASGRLFEAINGSGGARLCDDLAKRERGTIYAHAAGTGNVYTRYAIPLRGYEERIISRSCRPMFMRLLSAAIREARRVHPGCSQNVNRVASRVAVACGLASLAVSSTGSIRRNKCSEYLRRQVFGLIMQRQSRGKRAFYVRKHSRRRSAEKRSAPQLPSRIA